ncbi:hypothetical protein D3C80_1462880 [compost metagenome]
MLRTQGRHAFALGIDAGIGGVDLALELELVRAKGVGVDPRFFELCGEVGQLGFLLSVLFAQPFGFAGLLTQQGKLGLVRLLQPAQLFTQAGMSCTGGS